MSTSSVPLWIEALAAVLLVAGGLFSLIGALGLLRMKGFFLRMHASALANTIGAWCVTFASILYFSALESRLAIHAWAIIVLLSITVPVTTVLLARTALFRKRQAGADVPSPLGRVDEPYRLKNGARTE
ncbi:MAG: Na+/H+ antiporter subunit G [Betaproteobacteria bacterium]